MSDCPRCGGLLVNEWAEDAGWWLHLWRCVLCAWRSYERRERRDALEV